MTAAQGIELAKALVPLAWPLLAATIAWRIFPLVRSIASSRSFTIEIAGMKVGVQDATEQLRSQIEDLQRQVIGLRHAESHVPSLDVAQIGVSSRPNALLWVDDNPSNNAFEIAQLQDNGVSVIQVRSTQEAEEIIRGREFDAVISDMGRRENGAFNPRAGLDLLDTFRKWGLNIPFLVYSSEKSAKYHSPAVKKAGGDGATASAIELLEWVARTMQSNQRL